MQLNHLIRSRAAFKFFCRGLILGILGIAPAQAAQVALPVLAPSSTASNRYLSISITSATPDATIRYTLDGSEPVVTSPVYTAPGLPLGASVTVRAKAWKEGFEPSEVAEEQYVVTGRIAAGTDHVVALNLNGTVKTWGLGTNGRLADNRNSKAIRTTSVVALWGDDSTPVLISPMADIVEVAAGADHSLAIRSDGRVLSWGKNVSGQLGRGNTKEALYARLIPNLTDALAIAAGPGYSLILRDNGGARMVFSSGSNAQGRLGNAGPKAQTSPALAVQRVSPGAPNGREPLTGVSGIAAGGGHGLALTENQKVWAWGYNKFGQLGNGLVKDSAIAVPVLSGETDDLGNAADQPLALIEVIAAGAAHSVAIDESGQVWSWGNPAGGRLGTGPISAGIKQQPKALRMKTDLSTYFTGAVAVAAGPDYTLVTREDGTVWGCGTNASGVLGASSQEVYLRQITGAGGQTLENIAYVAAGNGFALAWTFDGAIYGWGNAANGHLGNGTKSGIVRVPSEISGIRVGNYPPQVDLTVTGSSTVPANDIALNAGVLDPDGHEVRVRFYWGDTLLGEKTQAPYALTLAEAGINELGVGEHRFKAVATDEKGANTTAISLFRISLPATERQSIFAWRGTASDPKLQSVVIGLDYQKGTVLRPSGFLPSDFGGTMPWFTGMTYPLLEHFLAWPTGQPSPVYSQPFENPIIAFGASACGTPLYTHRPYRVGVQFGGDWGTYPPQLRIQTVRKSDGILVGPPKDIRLPSVGRSAEKAAWEEFVRNGYTMEMPEFNHLKLRFHMIDERPNMGNAWGSLTIYNNNTAASYPGYVITHECDSPEYGYIVYGTGFAATARSQNPFAPMVKLVGSGQSNVYQPLYTIEFDAQAPWQTALLDTHHFQGVPMPSHYVGKSADELLNVKTPFSWQPAYTPAQGLVTNNSPELRRHTTLDGIVQKLTHGLIDPKEKALALTNFVLNEIKLCDPLGYNEAGQLEEPSINPGGVQRGAYATYMEGQGSPTEQCALLVYLLRQAKIPAVYVFPEHDKMLMLDKRLSTLLGMQISAALKVDGTPEPVADPSQPSLIPTNYPWVAVYVNDQWVHLFPWMKDVEIKDGYNIHDIFPEGYKTAHQWAAKFLEGDGAIHGLAANGDDTPAMLFPAYIKKRIQESGLDLNMDDFGIKINQRKHYYSEIEQLPTPFSISGNCVAKLNLDPRSFDTIKIAVGTNFKAGGIIKTGEIPLLEMHNRKLLVYHKPNTANNVKIKMTLSAFDPAIGGSGGTFSGAFASMGKAQNLAPAALIANKAGNGSEIKITIARQRTFNWESLPSNYHYWNSYLGISQPRTVEKALRIGLGDMAAVCVNYGAVTPRMLDVHAQEFWKVQGKANKNIEVYAGTSLYLMGMSYYQKLSEFGGWVFPLYRAKMQSHTGVGLSYLGAERTGGKLKGGNIRLVQPVVDMLEQNTLLTLGNTNYADNAVDSATGSVNQSFVIFTLAASAQEHATINHFYQKTDAISTVKLLRIAKENATGDYPDGYYVLNKSNYAARVALGNASTGDPGVWKSIKDTFDSVSGAQATVYITSKKVAGASGAYSGLGAFIWGTSGWSALISKNLNGGFGSIVPPKTFTAANAPNLNLGMSSTTGYYLNSLPSASNSYSNPVQTAPSISSYNSTYNSYHQANLGAFNVSPSQSLSVNIAGNALGLNTIGLSESALFGSVAHASKDQGFFGIGKVFGAVWNWVMDPVNAMTGAFYHDEVDLSLPGPMPLEIRRNYNSKDVSESELGYGWKTSLIPYLMLPRMEGSKNSDPITNPTTDIYAAEMDGSVIVYTRVGNSNEWRPTLEKNPQLANIQRESIGSTANLLNSKIVKAGANKKPIYTLTSPDGSERACAVKSYPIPGPLPKGVARINRKRPYLQTWKDSRGNQLTFTYGEKNTLPDYGLLKGVSSSNGASIGFNYDAYGHIVEAFTNDGRWVYYGYSQYGDLERVTRPDGAVFEYKYQLESQDVEGQTQWTSTHLISRENRPNGRILENDYDSESRVITQRAAVGANSALVVNARFEYQNAENADRTLTGYTVVKDCFDRPTRYDYANSQITEIVDAENQRTSYDWFEAGEEAKAGYHARSLEKITTPEGLETHFRYDSRGNLISKRLEGNLTGSGSPSVFETEMAYNDLDLLRESQDSLGNRTVYAYANAAYPRLPTSIERFHQNVSQSRTIREYGDSTGLVAFSKGLLVRQIVAAGTGDESVVRCENDARGFPYKITRYSGTNDLNVVTWLNYNARGELAQEMDAAGRKTGYAYDALGRKIWTEKRNESGELVWWNYDYYDGNGDLVWSDGPRYNPEDYVWRRYDGGGRLTEETTWRSQAREDGGGVEAAPACSSVFHRYNAFGDRVQTTDARGFVSTMTYDGIGRLTSRSQHSGGDAGSPVVSTESFVYDNTLGDNRLVATDPLGGVTTTTHTAYGKIQSREEPGQLTTRCRYDVSGRLERETLPNGNYWEIAYDDVQRIETRTLRGGGNVLATEVTKRDRRGNVIEKTDALGNTVVTTYDGLDRVKTVRGPAGTANEALREIAYAYDAAGKSVIETSPLGEGKVTLTDVAGRPTLIETRDHASALVRRTAFTYSIDHHACTVEEGSGVNAIRTTLYTDLQGREVIRRHPDGAFSLNRYDAAGNRTLARDALGRETRWTYDVFNRPDQETRPGGAVMDLDWDLRGNLTRRALPGPLVWSATYDEASRKTSEKLESGSGVARNFTYAYFAAGPGKGRLQTVTDPRGVAQNYAYDARGRLTSLAISGAEPEQSMTLGYDYDANDQLVSVAQTGGGQLPSTVSWNRGAYGGVVRETVSLGGAPHSDYAQFWDARGQRVKLQPTGQPSAAQTFAWREDGLLAETAFGGQTFRYRYGVDGLLQTRTGPENIRAFPARDHRGRAPAVTVTAGGVPVLTETFTWQADSTVAGYDVARAGSGAWNETRIYGYDVRGRLVAESFTPPAAAAAQLGYAFDFGVTNGLGVRTLAELSGSQTGQAQVPAGQVDGFGRVLQQAASGALGGGTTALAYDAAGNVTERSLPDSKVQTLKWDGLGRLAKVEERDGSGNGYDWVATYDGLGRRLKVVYQPVSLGIPMGIASEIASGYDPEVEFLEIETRQDGNTWRKVYGLDGEGDYGSQQGIGGLEAVISDGGSVSYPISDRFGNIVAWQESGAVTWGMQKVAYGLAPGVTPGILETGAPYRESLGWQGRRTDATGLTWMGARYYDSAGGKFISADPLGHETSWSLYDYANGDPVNFGDPDGRFGKQANINLDSGPISLNLGGFSQIPISDKAIQMIYDFEVGGSKFSYNPKPEWPGKSSGVTIGIGYDIGYNSKANFRNDWSGKISENDFERLSTVVGVKGMAAKIMVPQFSNISIPWKTAVSVFNETTLPKFIKQTVVAYPGSSALPPDSLGSLVSMTFNRGTAFNSLNPKANETLREKREIRDAIRNGDFNKVPDLIRKSKWVWEGSDIEKGMKRRREAEAVLFEKGLGK